MRKSRILKMVLLLLAFSSAACLPAGKALAADTIEGVITRTGPMGVDLTVYDQNGVPFPNGLHVKTDRRTQINGIPSAADLRTRDYIRAEVRQENDGIWRADSITRLGVANNAPQQQNSVVTNMQNMGKSLMDSLTSPTGQKYVKSSLTGAAVGGVSAMASGGKGGKGALFGAGLGALATLIQDLFNQRAQYAGQPQPIQPQAAYYDDRGYVQR